MPAIAPKAGKIIQVGVTWALVEAGACFTMFGCMATFTLLLSESSYNLTVA